MTFNDLPVRLPLLNQWEACKYCKTTFQCGYLDDGTEKGKWSLIDVLNNQYKNHFVVSLKCREEHYKGKDKEKEKEKPKEVNIRLGSGYGITMMTELTKIIKSMDDAMTLNNLAIFKRLNEIQAKQDELEKMIGGLMP